MKKLAFKVAFSAKIGSGHLYRCARLSAALKKKGVITYFLIDEKIKKRFLFLSKHFSFSIIKRNIKSEINFLKSENITNLLLDNPKLTFEEQIEYKSGVSKLFIYQDIPKQNIADVVINHNYIKQARNIYKKITKKKCKYYLGPKYYLFDNYRILNSKKNIISIFLGGNTPRTLLEKILKIINQNNLKNFKIIVFTGIFNKDFIFLKKKYPAMNLQLKIQKSQKIFFDIVSKSKIFFSAGGSTIIESIFLKTPTIAFLRGKNQLYNCLNLSNDKLIFFSGRTINEKKIQLFINNLINNQKYYNKFINNLNSFKTNNFKNKLTSDIFNEIK